MKKNIHPNYFPKATINCACGATLITGATHESLEIEICSQCHPFYTGKKKVIDTTGRVDRFKKLAEKSAKKKETVIGIKTKKAPRKTKAEKDMEAAEAKPTPKKKKAAAAKKVVKKVAKKTVKKTK